MAILLHSAQHSGLKHRKRRNLVRQHTFVSKAKFNIFWIITAELSLLLVSSKRCWFWPLRRTAQLKYCFVKLHFFRVLAYCAPVYSTKYYKILCMLYDTGMLFCHLTFITHRSNKVGYLRVFYLNISIICSEIFFFTYLFKYFMVQKIFLRIYKITNTRPGPRSL